MVPIPDHPFQLVVPYQQYMPSFDFKSLKEQFSDSRVKQNGITINEIMGTVKEANKVIQDSRGEIIKLERINMGAILGGAALFVLLTFISVAAQKKWWSFLIIYLILYVVGVVTLNGHVQRKVVTHLRKAHFMLALFCRSENNRLYLSKFCEVRPGYTAKFIVFNAHPVDIENPSNIIKIINQRNLREKEEFD